MNSTYKLVFSAVLNAWVAVAEHVRGRGKQGTVRLLSAAAVLAGGAATALAQAGPPAVNQLPTGAQVAAGTVNISQSQTAASMAIHQSTPKAIVNWQSFNVGANAKVNITQPSSTSVLLNRVQSSNPSQIFGQIKANGQVFLTNPNGVYFAPGSSVDVGSFTATTHGISDTDFLSGKYHFSRHGAAGSIVNQGSITAGLDGYIALLAPEVRNQGVVVAQVGGTVALAAGEGYQLQLSSNGQLTNVLVAPATIETLVDNGNAVQAPGGLIILSAQAANGLLGGVVKNSGAISATGLVSEGGTIRLSASHKIELAPTSRISADAAANSAGNGGRIDIIADLNNASSRTQVDGSISAKGGEQGGDGGFIETSATDLRIADATKVSTLAPRGQAGNWLLDPNDFEVSSTGNITGSALSTLLAGGNVTLQAGTGTDTTSAKFGNVSTTGTKGDINIYDDVSWSANTLTLNAGYNINVGSSSAIGSLTVTGSGSLNLNPSSSAVTGFTAGGAVLMGMAASPTSGLTGGYLSAGSFGAGAPTGFNGQINVSTSGTVKISNITYSVINSEAGFVGMASGGNYVMGSQLGFSTAYTAAVVASFSGKLNGFGHVISGLNINNSGASFLGLFNTSNGNVRNLGVTGSIVGGSWVGAISGFTNGLVISRSYSTVAVTGSGGNGGLVGLAQPVTISESYATGDVRSSASSAGSMGGLVGYLYGGSITSSYATGAVYAGQGGGGLVGSMQNNSSISNSFATGNVTAIFSNTSSFGGLVGYIPATANATITNSYASGAVSSGTGVTGIAELGGLTGSINSGVTATIFVGNNYWNSAANSSFNVSTGGTGNGTVFSGISALTASQMKSASNFSSTFGNTSGAFTAASGWGYQSGVNGGFPVRCTITACTAYDSSMAALTFNGASNGLWSIASNWLISGTSTVASFAPTSANASGVSAVTVNSGSVVDYDTASVGSLSVPIANAGTIAFTGNSNVSITGVISGTGALTKAGTGTVTFSGANTYSGGTTVSAGTLKLGSATAAGTGAISVSNGGALDLNGQTLTSTGALTLNGTGVSSGGALLNSSGTAATYAGAVTLASDASYGGSGAITFGSTVDSASSAAYALSGTSGGNLVFNAAVGASYPLASLGTGTGTTTLGANVTTVGAQTYGGPVVIKNSSGVTLANTHSAITFNATVDSDSATSYALTLSNGSGATTFTGAIGATDPIGALTVNGTGTITLGGHVSTKGNQSYFGPVSIAAGVTMAANPVTGSSGIITNGNNNDSYYAFGVTGLTSSSITESNYYVVLSGSSSSPITSASTENLGIMFYNNTGTMNGAGANNSWCCINYPVLVDAGQSTLLSSLTVVTRGDGMANRVPKAVSVYGSNTPFTSANKLKPFSNHFSNLSVLGTDYQQSNFSLIGSSSLSFSGGGTSSPTLSNTVSLTNSATYRYYQLVFNSSNGATDGGMNLSTGIPTSYGLGLALNAINMYGAALTPSAIAFNQAVTASGALTVNTGTLSATNISAGGVIGIQNSGAATVSGAISNNGANAASLVKSGAGTLTLSGSNTYTGGTTVSAGTLQVGAGGTAGSMVGNVINNATLAFSRSDDLTFSGVISGTGAVSKAGANTLTLSGDNTYSGTTTVSAGTLQVGAGGTSGAIAGDVSNNGTLVFNRSDAVTHSGVISGTGALTQSGAGTTTLTGANTYTGATTVSAGTLAIGNATGLGATAGGVMVASGATLDLQGAAVGAEAIALNGGTLATSAGTSSLAGAVTLGAASTIDVAGAASQLSLSGLVSGAHALTKTGAGKLVMSRQNTFSGGFTIAAGTATEATTYNGSSGPFGSGTVTVQAGATLDLNNYNIYAPVVLAGGALVNNATSGGVGQSDISLGVSLTADSVLGGAGFLNAHTAMASNGYGLVFLGAGTKNLSNVNNTLALIASGSGVGALNVANNQALTIGQVTVGGTPYSGINSTSTVSVRTRTGDLTVSHNVITTSSSNNGNAPALDLRAGTLTAAGTVTGGDLVLSGSPSFGIGANGLAVFYSGQSATAAAAALISHLSANSPFDKVYDRDSGSNIFGSGYWLAFRGAAPVNIYLLPVSGQSSTYGTAPTALNYCYSSSAASCVAVSYTGIPANPQSFSLASGAVSSTVSVASGVSGSLALSGSPSIASTGLVDTSNAGSYALTLTPSLTLLGYTFSAGNAVDFVVNRKSVTVTNTARSTPYDGVSSYTSLAAGTAHTVGAMVGLDAVASITQTPSGFSGVASGVARAGAYTITPSAAVLSTGAASNYNFIYVSSTHTVNKANATATGNSAAVTYNGANQTVTGFTVSGLQGTDTVADLSTVVAAGATGKNAGSYTNAVSAGTEANYTVTPVDGSLAIAKANATVTGNSGTVTYNGANQTVSGFTATGLVGGETAAVLTGVSASRTAKNAGSYAVTPIGTDGNYNLAFVDGAMVINKAALTATGNSAAVTYNGANQSVTGFTVSGLQGTDTVADLSSVVAAGATAKNAGSYTNAVSAGTEANYTVSTVDGSLAISKANATVTGNSGTVTYNGANQTVSGFTATGLVGGETETVLTGVSASRTAKNAGSYAVTPIGTDGNYNLAFVDGAMVINKAALTATGNSAAVTYNGANQSVAGFTVSGLQGTDTVADLSSVVAAGATAKNAGSYTNAVSAGTEANYTVSTVDGRLAISKANVTVTGNSGTVTYNGANQTASGFTATGLVGGETAAVLTGVSASRTAKNAGSYAVTPSGTDGNYNLSFADGALMINPAPLVITASSNTKSFDGNTSSLATPVVTGLQGSDTVSNLSQAYTDANPGNGKTLLVDGSYRIEDGRSGANYAVTLEADRSGVIRALPVAVLPPTPAAASTAGVAQPSIKVASAAPAGAAGGSSAGVSVSTINAASQQAPGLVSVMVPASTATAGTGVVIALPESVIAPAQEAAAPLSVTLLNNQPLPSWIRYEPASQSLITDAVPAGAFPITVVVRVGNQSTVVQISETQAGQ